MLSQHQEDERKRDQDYEPDTPRCLTCCYFKREPLDNALNYVQRRSRKGKLITVKVPPNRRRKVNPIVDKCTYGDFQVKPGGVCREWHGRDGSKLAEAIPMRLVEHSAASQRQEGSNG